MTQQGISDVERVDEGQTAVMFLHIPKTAGTTLLEILDRQYPPEAIYSFGVDAHESAARFKALDEAQKKPIRLLRRHMAYGLHDSLFFKATLQVFSIFRYHERANQTISLDRNDSMKTTLHELLSSGNTIIADGAMGSRLMAAGMPVGQASELWNVENPDAVREVHRSYIEAGSQIILTNSFGGSRTTLDRHGLADRVTELNLAAAQNARAEADGAQKPVLVGGSIGPCGELFKPFGPLDAEKGTAVFAEQAAALAAGGVDVFWIETMSDLQEVTAAVAGCRQAAPDIPVVTTLSFDRKGRTMMGVSPEQALEALKPLGVLALGGNCGNGPDEVLGVMDKMHAADPDLVLVAKANAGMPKLAKGVVTYDAGPEEMARYAVDARAKGARIIGACCGSTAEHIQAIAEAVS